jgi:hypothetical protein
MEPRALKKILEQHPGELMALTFLLMGIAFLLGAVLVEALGPVAGQGFPGLVNGADWQAGRFPGA